MPGYFIGLMSGTSLDGIDAVLVDFDTAPLELAATLHHTFPPALRERLLTLAEGRRALDLDDYGELDAALGEAFAETVRALLEEAGVAAGEVVAVGSHGQTVRHHPHGPHPFSLQIGDPARIAERTGITTVADFRRRDLAAGGQGAPLVPPFHAAVFARSGEPRAVLNIGGMANLTLLPGDDSAVTGFDTGPGNVLLDAWCQRHLGAPYDRNGEWACGGQADAGLLARLLDDPFFRQPPPKSTGRERFCLDWLDARLGALDGKPAAQDVQATLLELTARSVADALSAAAAGTTRLLVCGGGAHNLCLMEALARALPGVRVETTGAYGLPPDWVEAAAFAWLAKQTLEGHPGNLPSVTGAARPVVLGAIHPG